MMSSPSTFTVYATKRMNADTVTVEEDYGLVKGYCGGTNCIVTYYGQFIPDGSGQYISCVASDITEIRPKDMTEKMKLQVEKLGYESRITTIDAQIAAM